MYLLKKAVKINETFLTKQQKQPAKSEQTFGSNLEVASSGFWSGFNLRRDIKAFDGFPQITLPSVRSLASLVSAAHRKEVCLFCGT